jgi:hypothetical protein
MSFWQEHPLVDLEPQYRRLTDAELEELVATVGGAAVEQYVRDRQRRIARSVEDPYRFEFRLPHWDDVEDMVRRKTVTFIPGGNNPGKSRWAASLVVRFLLRQFAWEGVPPGRLKVLMVAQNDDASRAFQQDKVYAQLPREWRAMNEMEKKPRGFGKRINYSDKNGFTERTLVLPSPHQGQVWFKTAAQYVDNPMSFEGTEFDLVVIDEGCPLMLFNSLLGRAAKRAGKIIYLLTCVNGYDAVMGRGLEGAKITKTLPMQWDWLKQTTNESE